MEVVTGALPSLLPKLADLLIGEYNLHKEVKGGIKFLQTELESMKVALDKISETPLDKQDKIWARDVRELSYDIEDKIDTFVVCCKGSRLIEKHGLKNIIDRSHNILMQPNIRRKIATDIKDIKIRVKEVSKRRDRYKVNTDVSKPVIVDPRVLAQYEKTTALVHIDEARDELIKMMMESNEVSDQQEKIISIVGLGGLGKTTLAKVVFENLKEQFKCSACSVRSAFVPVSQTPDMEKLLKDMLYQLVVSENLVAHFDYSTFVPVSQMEELFNDMLYLLDKRHNASINVIIDDLRKFLQKKRYFVVLDDIWDISVWETIRCALPENNGGCKIITTTRILKVAEEIGGTYKMKPLCLHSSRILLYRRIYGYKGEDKCPDEELENISDRILTKCAGVPLAIITIASLLSSKRRNKLDWCEVYNSIGTGMEKNTEVENMRKVLSLSYYNLPSPLRTCLLYLSVFPEDYEIDRKRLIWMWIAEGFIQRGKQGHSLFDVGESYFNELVNRSMIQPVYGSHGIKIQSCRVHDVVLDLIRSISSEENFITTLNDVGHTSSPQKVRRLYLMNKKIDHHDTDGAAMSMQQVRSVVVFSADVRQIPALSIFEVVRVLRFENCDLSHGYNLKDIGKLVHLRYLGLCSTKIVQLPKEIGNLQFLHMLDITNNEMSTLPSTIVQLKQLKCLYIDTDIEPKIIGRLTSLEELSLSRINTDAKEFVEELEHLTELRVLHITYFGFEMDQPKDALVDCLHKLQSIEALSIDFPETINKTIRELPKRSPHRDG